MKTMILSLMLAATSGNIPEKSPYLIILSSPTTIYFPTGHRIYVPMGTEIDICPGSNTDSGVMDYHLSANVLEFKEPCNQERPLFSDGFESKEEDVE